MTTWNELNIAGQRFGKLVAIERIGRDPLGAAVWSAMCDCGNLTSGAARNIRAGKKKSCGCLSSSIKERATTHGASVKGSRLRPTYQSWLNMRMRCLQPTHQAYSRYAGRGIGICERWASFENFLEDMGERPSPKHSIERIDNDGHYEPGNCRWATIVDQARNRRSNVHITYCGETLTLSQWSERTGLAISLISRRLQAGLEPDEILTKPSNRDPNHRPTHCKRGHAMTPENVYIAPSGGGRRACRECSRITKRSRRRERMKT
jgi:hypothetical protein